MNDALLVGLFERLGDLLGDLDRLIGGNRPSLQAPRKVLAFDQLEYQKGLPVGFFQAVDRGDVRVVQGPEEVGLALEPREALGVAGDLSGENLDRNVTPEVLVRRAVHLAHAALSQLGSDSVVRERCPEQVAGFYWHPQDYRRGPAPGLPSSILIQPRSS